NRDLSTMVNIAQLPKEAQQRRRSPTDPYNSSIPAKCRHAYTWWLSKHSNLLGNIVGEASTHNSFFHYLCLFVQHGDTKLMKTISHGRNSSFITLLLDLQVGPESELDPIIISSRPLIALWHAPSMITVLTSGATPTFATASPAVHRNLSHRPFKVWLSTRKQLGVSMGLTARYPFQSVRYFALGRLPFEHAHYSPSFLLYIDM
ncbi:hypothetical protein JB92DRAFT_2978803, partial [Gautieria morchelliformis]